MVKLLYNYCYVTETLAAVLALHNADEFSCDYVGNTQAAKRYGKMAPTANGSPTPIVPKGPELRRWPG